MIAFDQVLTHLSSTRLGDNAQPLIEAGQTQLARTRHGDLPRWQAAVESLPELPDVSTLLDSDCVTVDSHHPLPTQVQSRLLSSLRALRPWRKGPYRICGIHIDTEWRSDWKWRRVREHLTPLTGRRVLDVGCGSGYHVWRMLGDGANVVVGIDPGLLFNMQFNALQHFIQQHSAVVLPLRLEQTPALACFDTVFSMGVLYHRREPQQHLQELKNALAPQGELVLESLVIPPGDTTVLRPSERYARMRNVWQIPSSQHLCEWLEEAGFRDIRVVSEAFTCVDEQRTTDWMPFESLAESLHPESPELTIEGYPAPRRALLIARL